MKRILMNPVFRRGAVCSPKNSKRLTLGQANAVGQYFKGYIQTASRLIKVDSLKRYIENYQNFCKKYSIETTITKEQSKNEIRFQNQLTPVIRFPAFFIKLDDIEFVARESVTVCIGKSDSKIWISLSMKDEKKDRTDELKSLYNQFVEYANLRISVLMDFYSSVIRELAKTASKAYNDFNKNKYFEIVENLSIIIASLESVKDINNLLDKGLEHGHYYILHDVEKDSKLMKIFKPFFRFAKDNTGVEAIDQFKFFIQNSTPMFYEGRRVIPYVVDGRSSLQRKSLVLSIMDREHENCPLEYYFTIGSNDNEFTHRRYRNSDLSSRSLMKEVGRVY